MMGHDSDEDRIRRKAHELWEAAGHPHGSDQSHWDEAREIIAIEDSLGSTLLPRETGADEPIEVRRLADNFGDVPNLTDQGEHALTDTAREPSVTRPVSVEPKGKLRKAAGKTAASGKPPAQPDAIVPVLSKDNPVVRATGPAAIAARVTKSTSRKPTTTGTN